MKPTVGEQLRSARESRGLTLEDAVKATNIRRAYLQELESDRPEQLHSAAQARGFLRLYAAYLGLPAAELIAAWDAPAGEAETALPEASAEAAPESAPLDSGGDEASVGPPDDASQPDAPQPDKQTEQPGGRLKKALRRFTKLSQFLPKRSAEERADDEKPKKSSWRERTAAEPTMEQPAPRPSREIMADIGRALVERRNALGLTLSDAETFTSVKRIYLEAMEDGQFDRMPSTVQGRGMLNNYAHFLALDETWIMDAYAKALLSQRAEKEAGKPPKLPPPLTVRFNIPEKWRNILNPDLIIGGLLIMGLFAFIIWGGVQVFRVAEPTATDAPSISEMLAQTATPTNIYAQPETEGNDEPAPQDTPIPGVVVAEATPTVAATINPDPLQLYIIVSDMAYLRVEVDDAQAFNGRVMAGEVFTFSGQEVIRLLTGNGAALEVYFNQEYIGDLGRVGEVVNLTFSLQGLITPTPLPAETLEPGPVNEDVMDAMEGG
jgi:cytoskeletal protein RodZ